MSLVHPDEPGIWVDLTLCMAALPERQQGMFLRAIESVNRQTLLPNCIRVEVDSKGAGAAATKNKALATVKTKFVAFLDDDDELLPDHVASLMEGMAESDADVVYTWPDGTLGIDPAPHRFGQPFSDRMLLPYNNLPSTSLFKTESLRAAGGFQYPGELLVNGGRPYANAEGAWRYDDWGAYLALWHREAKFHHVARRTWVYHQHPYQTAGMPGKYLI